MENSSGQPVSSSSSQPQRYFHLRYTCALDPCRMVKGRAPPAVVLPPGGEIDVRAPYAPPRFTMGCYDEERLCASRQNCLFLVRDPCAASKHSVTLPSGDFLRLTLTPSYALSAYRFEKLWLLFPDETRPELLLQVENGRDPLMLCSKALLSIELHKENGPVPFRERDYMAEEEGDPPLPFCFKQPPSGFEPIEWDE